MATEAIESLSKALTARAGASDSQVARVLASIMSTLLGFIVVVISFGMFRLGGVGPRHRLTHTPRKQ